MDIIMGLGDIVMRLFFICAAVVFTISRIRILKEGSNSVHYSKAVTIITLILGDAVFLYCIVTGFKGGHHISRFR